MANPGVAPPDFATNVGKFRLLTNDLSYVPLVPAVAGQGDFVLFADSEIEAYLGLETSVYRAAGLAFMGLAASAAQQAESVKDFDLAIDSRQKAENLRTQAMWFYSEADRIDGESAEGFSIVTTGRPLTRIEMALRDATDPRPIL